MKQICAFSLFRKGFAAFAALALTGAGVPLFAADLGANNHAANPELATQPKPKAVSYDSAFVVRHPSCDGGILPDYVLTGININTSTHKLEVDTACLPRSVSYALGHDIYFYNEFVYQNCDLEQRNAYPFMTTNGRTVNIYKGGGTEKKPIGIGWDFFESYKYNPSVELGPDDLLVFFGDTINYRCPTPPHVLDEETATRYVDDKTTIGNNIQKTEDPLSPKYQHVYLLEKDSFVYLFMVKRFKNADSGPNAQKMTIVLRKLN
jgi:hypothetical protein